ncbi:radical SAM protein [Thermodesulfobacteriota bacterium]
MDERIARLADLHRLYWSRALNTPLVRPRTVTITLTSRCNLKCVMCNHWRNPSRASEEISCDQVLRIIEEAADWGVPEIEFSGGEPMIRRDFLEMLSLARARGLRVNVTTNGTMIDGETARELTRTPGLRLQISIDGACAATHDEIRGVMGCYGRVMEGIALLREFNAAVENPIPLNATTVILDRNIDELVDIIALVRGLGFSSITFQPMVDDNLDIYRRDPENPLRPSITRLRALDRAVDGIIAAGREDGFVGNSLKNLESVKDYFRNRLDTGRIQCYIGFIPCIVSPDGKLWSCMGNMGDVFELGLRACWSSPRAREVRGRIKRCKVPCLYPCYLDTEADNIVEATLKALKG